MSILGFILCSCMLSHEWHSATIDYDYDNRENWITRKINGCDPRLMNSATNATRKIYYIEK